MFAKAQFVLFLSLFVGAALDASAVTVSVTKSGTGGGIVADNTAVINCGATCSANFNSGASVTLTAAPDAGSQFTGWLGPCTGLGACTFVAGSPVTAIATFAPIGTMNLDIDVNSAYLAPSDGTLVLRYMFGMSGNSGIL